MTKVRFPARTRKFVFFFYFNCKKLFLDHRFFALPALCRFLPTLIQRFLNNWMTVYWCYHFGVGKALFSSTQTTVLSTFPMLVRLYFSTWAFITYFKNKQKKKSCCFFTFLHTLSYCISSIFKNVWFNVINRLKQHAAKIPRLRVLQKKVVSI